MATVPCTAPQATFTLCWCQMTPIHWYIRYGQGQQVVDVIKAYHAVYPYMIYQPDALGATPLDVAIQIHNQEAAETILELDTINRRASEQVTTRHAANPIETKFLVLPRLAKIKRDGYSTDELVFEYHHHRVEGMPVNLGDYIKQRRWGCTCGACAEGWMSPRMRFRIASAAESISDLMLDLHASEFPRNGVHPRPDGLYPKIPIKLYPHVTLELWTGYSIVFEMIGTLLLGTDLPFTEAAVLRLARRKAAASLFLEKGGNLLLALDATMDMAWEESSRCGGQFEKVNADDEQYNALPTCKNDLNFELVRDRLGLSPDVLHEPEGGKNDSFPTLCNELDPVASEQLLRYHRAGEF